MFKPTWKYILKLSTSVSVPALQPLFIMTLKHNQIFTNKNDAVQICLFKKLIPKVSYTVYRNPLRTTEKSPGKRNSELLASVWLCGFMFIHSFVHNGSLNGNLCVPRTIALEEDFTKAHEVHR